ncbi:MAG: Hsp70 family protein [Methylobacteriaceae bacterium]|nr:Hsp70 family protein [Methylobacteriaceae bacterium]
MAALGLDFGTTNTVFATLDASGAPCATLFASGEGRQAAVRTALSFTAASKAGGGRGVEAGPWAIAAYLAAPEETRFLQSLKTYAASPHFSGATLFARRYAFEDLAELIVARLRARADGALDGLPARLVVGVPVAFAGAAPDAALARRRYGEAFGRFGFDDVRFVYEPVAAAFWFARRLERAATVLVADFGGGTTDYSLIRFEPARGGARARPLAHAGVGVAGDQFDYRIVDRLVLPRLGKGSHYKSMGRTMEIPPSLFANFARWNLLSTFRGSADHRMLLSLIRDALEPEKLALFAQLVEENEGYALYQAVSRAKTQLSSQASARLRFHAHGIDIDAAFTRAEFEDWIADDLARMEGALDAALARAGLAPGDVDRVFLTGGTSFTPAVRRIFTRRFGAAKIERGDELLSIAHGLALIGAREDFAAWEAPAA